MNLTELLDEEVGESYSVRLPTYVKVSRKSNKAVNLNIYRNLHHFHLDTQKKEFSALVQPLLKDKPFAERIWIHYTIYAPRKGRLDTMNVGSIVDKYFCDVLVKSRKIPDDHYDHVVLSTFSFGGVCPMDGHAIATVNILERKKSMRVFLDETEIKTAIQNYVDQHVSIPVQDLIFDTSGDTLEVEVVTGPPVPEEQSEDKPKKRRGRPKGSKNADKTEDTTDDSKPSEDSSDTTDSGGSEPPEADTGDGEKEPTEHPKTKNLFGDDDEKESSDSPTTSETETQTKEEVSPLKSKKTSIFDV